MTPPLRFLLVLLLGAPLAVATAQTPRRVAELQLGPAQLLIDATSDGHVAVTAVQNNLDLRARLALPELRAWLDTALVVTAAQDPLRPGMKWTYSVAGPSLFLYRVVGHNDEEFIVSVGEKVKISLELLPQDARALMNDLAAAARVSREMTAQAMRERGGACALGVTIALAPGERLMPDDSAALWLDRVREQIGIRLATVAGAASDAGKGVWFVAEEDGNASGIRTASADSPAVADLRKAIVQAGGWHAFKSVPGGRAVALGARLAPECGR